MKTYYYFTVHNYTKE